jgi:predicted nucleic acid-binding Zn ribbon protein
MYNSTHIQAILEEIQELSGLNSYIKENRIESVWTEVVGSIVAECTSIRSFEKGKLIVNVSHPVWKTEILMKRKDIINRLNENIGSKIVQELIVK